MIEPVSLRPKHNRRINRSSDEADPPHPEWWLITATRT